MVYWGSQWLSSVRQLSFPVGSMWKQVKANCKTDSESIRNSKNVLIKWEKEIVCLKRYIDVHLWFYFVLWENSILWWNSQIWTLTKGSGPPLWKHKCPYPLWMDMIFSVQKDLYKPNIFVLGLSLYLLSKSTHFCVVVSPFNVPPPCIWYCPS